MQATCARAIERADQFDFGNSTRPLAVRYPSVDLAQRYSRAAGSGGRRLRRRRGPAVDAHRAHVIESNILAAEVLKAIGGLPEALRETVFLVYGEGYSYAEAAKALEIPIGNVMSSPRRSARGAGKTEIGPFNGR